MPLLRRPVTDAGFAWGQSPSGPVAAAAAPQRVYRMTLPADPEQASMVTLDFIHGLVRAAREDPIVRQKALQICQQAGVRDGRSYEAVIRAIHHWVQRNITYFHDPAGVEFITEPRVMLHLAERGQAVEDCEAMVALEQSLLNACGVPTHSVIWKADSRAPDQWSHITLEAHDSKRWVALDPIMKDKPIGWQPPRYYGKRVVPVGDGAPFPPAARAGAPQALPMGMTVDVLQGNSRETARGFFHGAVGILGWHGFSGYGQEPTGCPRDYQYDADAIVLAALEGAGETRSEAVRLRRLFQTQVNESFPPSQRQGFVGQPGGPELEYSRRLFRISGQYRRAIAPQLDAQSALFKSCAQQAYDEARASMPAQLIARLEQRRRALVQMRDEALNYFVPLIDSATPLVDHAEQQMGRITERQAFLGQVDQVAQVVSTALSLLGSVTAGVTEVLAIAVTMGNLAFQYRQQSALLTGSAAATLGEISSSLSGIEQALLATEEVVRVSDARAAQITTVLEAAGAGAPELAVVVAEAREEGRGISPVLIVGGIAAAVALLLVVI